MRAALQKLETRVSVLEKSPVPAASPCVTVADLLDVYGHFKKHNLKMGNDSQIGHQLACLKELLNIFSYQNMFNLLPY